MTIALERGKKYINGDGRIVMIIAKNPLTTSLYPFLGSNGKSYMADGRYYAAYPIKCWDLVEEKVK